MKKERGISVTSSVLQFEYEGKCLNILDTPGHEDFSEDTYRTLMAADCAVMVIDASTRVWSHRRSKLFKVCVMRHIPIFTFINKMDREAKDTFELLDDIEKVLGSRHVRSTGRSDVEKNLRVYTSVHQEISYDSRQSPQVVQKQKKRSFQQMMIMQQI